jgi:hypothetical protein
MLSLSTHLFSHWSIPIGQDYGSANPDQKEIFTDPLHCWKTLAKHGFLSGKKSHSSSKLKREKERRGEGGEKHKLSKEERRERKLKKKQKAVSSSTAEDSPVKVGHIPYPTGPCRLCVI